MWYIHSMTLSNVVYMHLLCKYPYEYIVDTHLLSKHPGAPEHRGPALLCVLRLPEQNSPDPPDGRPRWAIMKPLLGLALSKQNGSRWEARGDVLITEAAQLLFLSTALCKRAESVHTIAVCKRGKLSEREVSDDPVYQITSRFAFYCCALLLSRRENSNTVSTDRCVRRTQVLLWVLAATLNEAFWYVVICATQSAHRCSLFPLNTVALFLYI